MHSNRKILLGLILFLNTFFFVSAQEHSQFQLQKICKGPEQITEIIPFPVKRGTLAVLGKKGQLGLCSLMDGKFTLIQKMDVVTYSEMGLLSIAFHPKFESNGLFYLHMNVKKKGQPITELTEWKFSNPKDPTSPKKLRVIFETAQPYSNHNGGPLVFDSQGHLLLGLGDGGAANDPHGYGQNRKSFLGKILEFDVEREKVTPEIYAIGLRNPWKMSWAPTGQLIVADVGQNRFEEIHFVEKGKNYGWNILEGSHCFKPKENCSKQGLELPIFEYDHSLGQSVTGGYVATAPGYREIKGQYILGDFASGRVLALSLEKPYKAREIGKWPHAISTFGRTVEGEILIGDFNDGTIYRLDEVAN